MPEGLARGRGRPGVVPGTAAGALYRRCLGGEPQRRLGPPFLGPAIQSIIPAPHPGASPESRVAGRSLRKEVLRPWVENA